MNKVLAIAASVLLVIEPSYGEVQCQHHHHALAARLLNSTIARGQGVGGTNASTSQIELGIFQQALRESIAYSADESQRDEWTDYLQRSTAGVFQTFTNVTADVGLPLDRLSIGTSMIHQSEASKAAGEEYASAISALRDSVALQPRNANDGLWYYDNQNNLSAYHNLSYLDGMYSYAPFAILAAGTSADLADDFGSAATLKQVQILYDICKVANGLVVHGYDASKTHAWADPKTGASPVVWGRSLAWFTLGIVNSLDVLTAAGRFDRSFTALKQILSEILCAQLRASEESLRITGKSGVWQVVDHSGASFDGHANFIEASASSMTAYSLLRSARSGYLEGRQVQRHAMATGIAIYNAVVQDFLIAGSSGELSLNGTSSVASLSGNVDYVVSKRSASSVQWCLAEVALSSAQS